MRTNNGGGAQFLSDSNGYPTSIANPQGAALKFSPRESTVIAALGDSITEQNNYGSIYLQRAIGYMTWAMVLSGGKISFSVGVNFGVSGDTSTMALARLPAAITSMKAAGAQYCTVLLGTNDLGNAGVPNPVPYATFVSNMKRIYGALIGAGITPIAIPIPPRSFSMTTALRQGLQRMNTWIREYARSNPGILIADATLNVVDHAATNGDPIGASTAAVTAYTFDGLHYGHRGAYWQGLAVYRAVQYALPAQPTVSWSQSDTYSATDNPTGDLLANAWMTGITGTLGTGTSGSLATSYTAQRSSGTTGAIVCSKGTIAVDNGTTYPKQILACTAVAGSATETFRLFHQVFSNSAVGDVLVGECEISVSGVTADSFRYIFLNMSDGTNSAIMLQNDTGSYFPNNDWTGVIRTPPLTVTAANVVSLTLQWALDGTVASNGVTVTVSRMSARKYVAP